jgi:hypothetical protein
MTQIAPDTLLSHGVGCGDPGHTDPLPPFASVICLVDRSSAGHAARQQATALAAEGAVEIIATPRPGRSSSALLDRCDGADLLVLGASDEAIDLIRQTSLPVLLARSCSAGPAVTDRMLLAVDDESDPRRAAEIAAELAAGHRGTVAVVRTPRPNRAGDRRSQPHRAPGRGHAGPRLRAGRPCRARDLDRSGSRGCIASRTPARQHEERQEQSCHDRTARRVLSSAHPRPSCTRTGSRPPEQGVAHAGPARPR